MPLLSVKPTDFTSKIIPPSLAQLFFSKISWDWKPTIPWPFKLAEQ
jgi:hypothetical protein